MPCLRVGATRPRTIGGRRLRRFVARDREQPVEIVFGDALQGAEVGARQRRALEVAQQSGAIASLLRLDFFASEPAGSAPIEFVGCCPTVFVADLAGGLASKPLGWTGLLLAVGFFFGCMGYARLEGRRRKLAP